MTIFLRSRLYPLFFLISGAEKINLMRTLSDLTLMNRSGFLVCLAPAGYNRGSRVVWFTATVMQRWHQTKTLQDGWQLLLAYWPLIGNNKHSLNTITPWHTDSNQPPTARRCITRTHTRKRDALHKKSYVLVCKSFWLLTCRQKIMASTNVAVVRRVEPHHTYKPSQSNNTKAEAALTEPFLIIWGSVENLFIWKAPIVCGTWDCVFVSECCYHDHFKLYNATYTNVQYDVCPCVTTERTQVLFSHHCLR